jgi:uroporphyrinogen decarboxylase
MSRRLHRREELTSRERVRLALAHQETDRSPIAMVCSGINPPARRALQTYLQRERGIDVQTYLDTLLDIRQVDPAYIGPPLPPGEDIWGVRRVPVSYGSGSYDEIAYYPLAEAQTVDELDDHRWPSAAWFDHASLPDRISAAQSDGERCLMVSNGNIFETSWYMRGFQRMFADLALNPELAHAIMGRVTDFYVEHFSRMLAAADGAVDLAFTADDIAGQNGLLMSLDMWEEFLKPYHARLNKAIHEFGVKVIYHTDGAAMEAVEGLIDMGIDVLQALQFSAKGMDPRELKRRFGDRLCFEGGVSVQTTLPFGTVDDVRQEVEELITVLGESGGYILGPSHAIQAGTPSENIVAMFDTAVNVYPHHR